MKDFKNRMKKVLAEEEKKPDFDIREYEMEVLDVAKKEEQELSHVILSPDPDLTPALSLSLSPNVSRSPVASDLIPEFNSRVYFDGLPRPSASSHSEEGLKWVSLKHIFAHMKTLDRQEAARMFYAVLALVSSLISLNLIRYQAGNRYDYRAACFRLVFVSLFIDELSVFRVSLF